jgi:hypothetical protein
VNFSRFAFINDKGLVFPRYLIDSDGDFAFESQLIEFKKFDADDYDFYEDRIVLMADFEIGVFGHETFFVKADTRYPQRLALIYSFKIMDGGNFGKYLNGTVPKTILRFTTGNLEEGYYHDLLMVLEPFVDYELLYHSESLAKAYSLKMHWDDFSEVLSLVPSEVI